jgi:hypothetical protein
MKQYLEQKLDELFPKGESKERGAALVLYAEAVTQLNKMIDRELIEKWLVGFRSGIRLKHGYVDDQTFIDSQSDLLLKILES